MSSAQLRAARGLLDWTRSDLSKSSGVSVETIKNIERNVYMPQETTVNAIINAFAEHDVEFTEDDGVRSRKNRVRTYAGKKGYLAFLDHVYASLKDHGGRIRQFNLSDGAHLPYAGEFALTHLNRMTELKNIDARVLTQQGDLSFPAPYCEYRWFKKKDERQIPYYICNDYLWLVIHRSSTEFETVSIHSRMLSDIYNNHFESFWNEALTPSGEAA
ncbi:MAG: XRE family transcriptional regulator [Proteobacteria bacterium]|nr:XRE family transcriptional regulator [Pseudomonadota bacterium]